MASSNCVASTSIGCIFCCHGCNASKLRNAFTFIPPPKSYDVKDGRLIYYLEGHRHHPVYQAAAEVAQVHMVKTGMGERIPALWLSRKEIEGENIQEYQITSVGDADFDTNSQHGGMPNPMVCQRSCMNSCLVFKEPRELAEMGALSAVPDDERHHQIRAVSASRPAAHRLRRESSGEQQVAAKTEKPKPFVLIHCHGNATDVGLMMSAYWELSKQLGVDVVGVEYSGYGQASGSPSPAGAILDVEAVYDYVVQSGVAPQRIVAYGQSVGCGPTVALACRRTLGGVVLHSPMLSGIKVIDPAPDSCCRPSCMYACFDFFRNEEAMACVECPVFVIHGKEDNIVPFHHGLRLFEASPQAHRWPGYFPEHAGHNDIVELDAGTYFSKLRAFVNSIKDQNAIVSDTRAAPKAPPVQEQMREDREGTTESVDPVVMCEALSSGKAGSVALPNPEVEPMALPFHEPVVGPSDNIYDKMRHNHLKVKDMKLS